MRDLLPADVRKRNYVIGIIKEVYESYGFEPLETPAVENLSTLTDKYGEEGGQLIFKILKRGDKLEESLGSIRNNLGDKGKDGSPASPTSQPLSDLALRYDLTVPLARVVANRRNELPKFFKRYQIQPVWRADRPGRGRYREFYQCDVDAIGSTSIIVEVEQISAVSEILERLGFQDFVIRINHREILRAMLDSVNIPAEKHPDALVALDKLDKIGTGGVLKEFAERKIDGGEKLLELFEGGNSDLPAVAEFIGEHETGGPAINDIRAIFAANGSKTLSFDPSLARGLSYYTGAIFEINVPDLAGSLGGGGRYDDLIGMFAKEQIPACGFSLGLERILVVMDERGMFPPDVAESRSADVMVAVAAESEIAESLRFAAELRGKGLRVLVYPEADKLGKQFKYADSINIPFVFILGEREIAEGKVTLKNMRTGEQETLDRNSAAAKLG